MERNVEKIKCEVKDAAHFGRLDDEHTVLDLDTHVLLLDAREIRVDSERGLGFWQENW
jgi:hypothetical protein